VNAIAVALVLVALAAAVHAIARAGGPTGAPSAFERAFDADDSAALRIDQLAHLERLVASSRAGEIDPALRDELEAISAERQGWGRGVTRAPQLDPTSMDDYVRWLEEL
jgi:hypothetical protein